MRHAFEQYGKSIMVLFTFTFVVAFFSGFLLLSSGHAHKLADKYDETANKASTQKDLTSELLAFNEDDATYITYKNNEGFYMTETYLISDYFEAKNAKGKFNPSDTTRSGEAPRFRLRTIEWVNEETGEVEPIDVSKDGKDKNYRYVIKKVIQSDGHKECILVDKARGIKKPIAQWSDQFVENKYNPTFTLNRRGTYLFTFEADGYKRVFRQFTVRTLNTERIITETTITNKDRAYDPENPYEEIDVEDDPSTTTRPEDEPSTTTQPDDNPYITDVPEDLPSATRNPQDTPRVNP